MWQNGWGRMGPLEIESKASSKQSQLKETPQVYIWLVFRMPVASLGNLCQCSIILTAKNPKPNRQTDKTKTNNQTKNHPRFFLIFKWCFILCSLPPGLLFFSFLTHPPQSATSLIRCHLSLLFSRPVHWGKSVNWPVHSNFLYHTMQHISCTSLFRLMTKFTRIFPHPMPVQPSIQQIMLNNKSISKVALFHYIKALWALKKPHSQEGKSLKELQYWWEKSQRYSSFYFSS